MELTSFEIGQTLDAYVPFRFDIASIVTGRTFIGSITRWGKSWTSRKIIEQCFGHTGIIIIDPEGEYASLREKFAFLIIGKDIPLQLETAEFIAEKILESKTSVIIDLSMVEDDEMGKEYVNKFLRRFFFLETTLRQPYLIVVEESEDFAGEKGIGTETCLRILVNIVKKGGKRGIGAIFLAHRPAWVSKGILSQCSNKAIGKVESTDFKALEQYARVPDEIIEKLPTLKQGEFCFVGDWVKEPTFVKIGQVQTTHLGYTPKIIPPSPKELQGVITTLQNTLPQIIEKIKPTVIPIEKIREQMDEKYRDRIVAIQRTADEKAERKLRAEMERLKDVNDKLSRSQALQPTSPVTNVLEHPIVRTRMSELPDKARDLLTKVEQESGLTREQLAAFLTTSTNSVASLIVKVNQVFRAQVIIGEGKPIKYRSMLKRLFITDVGKREIEELQRLQKRVQELQASETSKGETIQQLRAELNGLRGKSNEVESLRTTLEKTNARLENLAADNQRLLEERKELMLAGKAGDALAAVIDIIVDHRLAGHTPQSTSLDEGKIQVIIDRRIAEKKADMMREQPSAMAPDMGTAVSLERKVTHFELAKNEERLQVSTEDLQGRIVFLITKGFFEARHKRPEVVEELSNHGWNHDGKEVDAALLELCQKGVFYRKISTGNAFWYTLQPEAKSLIREG